MNLRKKHKEDYAKYLQSKGKSKRLTDYDKPQNQADKHINKKKKAANDYFAVSGVYYLMRGNVIIYIGESSCVFGRIAQHKKEGLKEFTHFSIDRIEGETRRKQAEKRLIKKYRPICNSVHNNDVKA